MPRALASLLALLFLLHAAVPALPGFVCRGMGLRLLHPCCSEDAPAEGPVLRGRCCDPAAPVSLEPPGQGAESGRRALAAPPPAQAVPVLAPAPGDRYAALAPRPRSQAPPGRRPPERPLVLRI